VFRCKNGVAGASYRGKVFGNFLFGWHPDLRLGVQAGLARGRHAGLGAAA